MEFEGADPAAVVVDHTLAIEHVITNLPPKTGLQLLSYVRRRMEAAEARIVADRYEAGSSDRGVEDLLGNDGKTSKTEAKKRARRGKATNANPDIADRIAKGNLSAEQADIIATAADQTDGAAACDQALIDEIAATTPEQGKKKATKFVNDHTDPADIQTRHDRQRRRRGWYRHRLQNGNSAITFHGDDESIDHIERCVNAQADAEYRSDGGRDVPVAKHPRTTDQRGFDAAHTLITGHTTTSDQAANPDPASTPDSAPKSQNRRSTIFVKTTVDQLTGIDPSIITGADGKPLPNSVIEQLAQHGDFIGQIYSTHGELLWQGRKTRLATPAQILGLIARDGGCVRCGAHYDTCVAHHLLPYEAPAKGQTNIDQLAFVCEDCHVRLHHNKQTLYYDQRSQTWKLRAATWDEIPPDGGPQTKGPPGAYTNNTNKRPRNRTRQPVNHQPRLDERRSNRRRHDPHGDRLF
ncbi:MAG: HNH endonuclease signature motif containing protein [Acidimicrobiia bacterium]|nr:HNH endonuclease signature motif containing protein [Acidimicrobiia bacterium]